MIPLRVTSRGVYMESQIIDPFQEIILAASFLAFNLMDKAHLRAVYCPCGCDVDIILKGSELLSLILRCTHKMAIIIIKVKEAALYSSKIN